MLREEFIQAEIEHLDRLFRSGRYTGLARERLAAALDALRWVVGERAILRPSELSVLS